jgi:hypothetical protein
MAPEDGQQPLFQSMKAISLMAAGLLLASLQRASAQGSTEVNYAVRFVSFTNSASFGYPDGELAGPNYLLGLYGGLSVHALQPLFIGHPQFKTNLRFFNTQISGILPGIQQGTPYLLQFRIWPDAYDTYEAAITSGLPVPVGKTALFYPTPFPPPVIYPVIPSLGDVTLQPIPEPSVLGLFSGGLICAVSLRFFRWVRIRG